MPSFFKKTSRSFPFRSVNEELRVAVKQGQIATVSELIAKGAKFVPDKDGRTALHLAAISGAQEIGRILIENGCDVNVQDKLGYTALQRATLEGHVEMVRLLVDANSILEKQDFVQENTALHEAACCGNSGALELLLQLKANLYLRNRTGSTALHMACQNGHNKCCKLLLTAGCKTNVKDKYDDTPLHTACRYIHTGVSKILLDHKGNPNEQNKNGDTPLHLSCNLGQRKLAKLLTEYGANHTIKNKQGESPMDIAIRKKLNDVVETLKDTKIIPSQADPQSLSLSNADTLKLNRQRKSKIRERLRATKAAGSQWQLLFTDWMPPGSGAAQQHVNSTTNLAALPQTQQQQPGCPCSCNLLLHRLAKQTDEAHRELLEEMDAVQAELSHEIKDLRHESDRKFHSAQRHLRSKRSNTHQSSCVKYKQDREESEALRTDKNMSSAANSVRQGSRRPSAVFDQFQTRFNRTQMIRSKSESELETDVERGRNQVDIDSDSVSNASDDIYVGRWKVTAAQQRSSKPHLAVQTVPYVPQPQSKQLESSLKASQSVQMPLERSATMVSMGHFERQKQFEESVEQFNTHRADSPCTSPTAYSSNNYTTTTDSSNRHSLYSYNSRVSHTQQPSMDSGYSSNLVDNSHTQQPQQGYGDQFRVSESFENALNQNLQNATRERQQYATEPIRISSFNTSPNAFKRLMGAADWPSVSPFVPISPAESADISAELERLEAETQTHDYTELDFNKNPRRVPSGPQSFLIVTATPRANGNRPAPTISIPPPPRKPLPPLPPTNDYQQQTRRIAYRGARVMCTNV